MATPKRILMASHIAEPKGSAMSFFTLLSGLDNSKFLPVPVFSKKGPLVQQLNNISTCSTILPYHGAHKLLTLYKAKKIIKNEKIDLIYVNCAVGFSRVIAIAGKELGIPVVWHIREPPTGSRVIKNMPWIQKTASKVIVVSQELEKHFDHLSSKSIMELIYRALTVK